MRAFLHALNGLCGNGDEVGICGKTSVRRESLITTGYGLFISTLPLLAVFMPNNIVASLNIGSLFQLLLYLLV